MGRRRREGVAAKRELQQPGETNCRICGLPLGKHRYGDDACPNVNWRPGNGQRQWGETSYTEARTVLENVWA